MRYAPMLWICSSLAVAMAGASEFSLAQQANETPAVLKGYIHQDVYAEQAVSYQPDIAYQVVRQSNGQPLEGVQVSIPSLGFRSYSQANGEFALPNIPEKTTIVAFTKAGYIPQTMTLDEESRYRPLKISLKETRGIQVLDTQLRHLGDNSFSVQSSGAMEFRQQAEGASLIRTFTLPTGTKKATVEIGSVIGLDTINAHVLGQSQFHKNSTPMLVLLNGVPVTEITANGDGLRIPLPSQLLQAGRPNTLELRTGYQLSTPGRMDYDDIELMLITLNTD